MDSISSLKMVAVPCAEIKSIFSLSIPASFNVLVTVLKSPSPVREGPEIWFASLADVPSANSKKGALKTVESDDIKTPPAPSPKVIPFLFLSNGLQGSSLIAYSD